jgi:hypothetical protein
MTMNGEAGPIEGEGGGFKGWAVSDEGDERYICHSFLFLPVKVTTAACHVCDAAN